jgi:hypothetical protein
MRPTRLQCAAQRRAGAQQMRLSHVLIERLWAQPVGQRAIRPVHFQALRAEFNGVEATPSDNLN